MTQKICPVLDPEERRINEIISSGTAGLDHDSWCLLRTTHAHVANQSDHGRAGAARVIGQQYRVEASLALAHRA